MALHCSPLWPLTPRTARIEMPSSVQAREARARRSMGRTTSGSRVSRQTMPRILVSTSVGTNVAVVPYEVAGQKTVNVVVVYRGNASAPFQVAVAASKTAIFTNDSSGHGQGAILNQDYSRNGPANPAPRGQYVFIYGTGEGVTT